MVGIRSLPLALLALAVLPASAFADTRIIVKREPGLTAAERAELRADADVRLVKTLSLSRTEVVAAEAGDVSDAVQDLQANPDVVYAERASVRRAAAPDPYLGALWALNNTGQDIGGGFVPGEPDADMDVFEAWRRAPAPIRPSLSWTRASTPSILTSWARSSAAMTSSTKMTTPTTRTATVRT